MERVLGIPRWSIQWSLRPEYHAPEHRWDGTADPLVAMLEALWHGRRRVGVESANGTNKTYTAAAAMLWFLANYPGARVFSFAPKEKQPAIGLWAEVGKFWQRFKSRYSTAHLAGDLSIYMRPGPNQESWSAHGYGAAVRSGEQSNTRTQGIHAEHMLFIVEEMPGVAPSVIEAVKNTASAPHNLILGLGNPDHQQDPLHQFCTSEGALHIRISAYDHPNVVTGDASLIPGATTREQVREAAADYGEDSPFFLSRRRGICPAEAADALIKKVWLEQAIARGPEMLAEYERERRAVEWAMGVDVANSPTGDEAAIVTFKGQVCVSIWAQRIGEGKMLRDATQLGQEVIRQAAALRISPRKIGVDSVGVGAATVGEMRRQGRAPQALGGGDASVRVDGQVEEFRNLRSQMWWQARVDLQDGSIGIASSRGTTSWWSRRTRSRTGSGEVRTEGTRSSTRTGCGAIGANPWAPSW
jgi:hypothetical protein